MLYVKPGTHWRQSWIQHGRPCWKSTVAETGNKSATKSTVAVYVQLCCRYGRLCCQCVRDQSDTVDFADFQHSRPCWIQLCRQCVLGFRTHITFITNRDGGITCCNCLILLRYISFLLTSLSRQHVACLQVPLYSAVLLFCNVLLRAECSFSSVRSTNWSCEIRKIARRNTCLGALSTWHSAAAADMTSIKRRPI